MAGSAAPAAAQMRYRIKGTRVYVEPQPGNAPPRKGMSAFTGVLGNGALPTSYEAAGSGRRATGWTVSSAGPNATLTYALPVLRSRSRAAIRQNAHADAALSGLETNVVGTGIKPMWATPDAGLNRDLAALWLDWTDEADADGRLDFYGLQALAFRGVGEAGEMFGRHRLRRPGDTETVPYQVQLLEPEYVPTDWTQAAPGRQSIMGVEFDLVGRRTAYWMYPQHPNDTGVIPVVDLNPRPVPASEVMHLFAPRRAGQIRGEPWLTRALVKLRELDAYDDAELVRKKTAAMFAAFVTRKPDDDGSFVGNDTGTTDDDSVKIVGLEPGTVQYMDLGEDVKFATPADVGANYEPFMRAQLRAVASAAGMLYEQLSGDWSQINDRTYRASVNEFRRRVQMYQHHLVVFGLCRPVVRRWLVQALNSGAIALPRGMDERLVTRVRWVPQAWAYINPLQDVEAQEREVRAGFNSRTGIVSNRGEEAAEIDRQQADDNARADDLGVVYDSDGRVKASRGSSGTIASDVTATGTDSPAPGDAAHP